MAGDQHFRLNYDYQTSPRGFTFERSGFSYRPSVGMNQPKSLWNNFDVILDVLYTFAAQYEAEKKRIFESGARIASVAMMATIKSTVTYLAQAGVLSYQISSHGIDDVNCAYKK